MHPLAAKETALLCERRARGSCEPPVALECLEDTVIELWNELQTAQRRLRIAMDPDEEPEAGTSHWEAPAIDA